MPQVFSPTVQLDACVVLAPARLDEAARGHAKSLAALAGAELPLHVLVPDEGQGHEALSPWSAVSPSCRPHHLPATAGTSQTRAFADYLHENGILRPWLILWEPSLVRLAMRVYAPAKAFVAGSWLPAKAAAMDPIHLRIEQHHLHIFMMRQAGVVFLSDEPTERYLRKDLGYYGKVIARPSWESAWKSERDAASKDRAAHTPHYSHKLEILVEMETPTLQESVHAKFIDQWMQCSRHRIGLCRHVEDTDHDAAMRSREEFDVLLRVCEPAGGGSSPAPDWSSWKSLAGYKMILIPNAQPPPDSAAWAQSHKVHQVLSGEFTIGSEAVAALDEMLSRGVHGLQHWTLHQPKFLIHHGIEAGPVPVGAGGLDEIYEYQDYIASIWPLNMEPQLNVLQGQREVLQHLDKEVEDLELQTEKPAKTNRILSSIKKRMKTLFR